MENRIYVRASNAYLTEETSEKLRKQLSDLLGYELALKNIADIIVDGELEIIKEENNLPLVGSVYKSETRKFPNYQYYLGKKDDYTKTYSKMVVLHPNKNGVVYEILTR